MIYFLYKVKICGKLGLRIAKKLCGKKKRGKETALNYADKIEAVKAHICKKQLEHIESLTPVMEAFLVSLLTLEGNKTVRRYFLQCIKLQLNNLSRESVSDMQHRYQSAKKEINELQAKKKFDESSAKYDSSNSTDYSDREKGLKKKLEDLQNDIINSSFGLEHLFRELGQVYEAVASKPDLTIENLYRLPRVAAEHLIDGYPLELMDGDAAHVPLEWVTAVLEETSELLENPSVFVLSVLGLQSTGKSTMLNTVFGLQFKVSAGRCTCGAFMQLLPLDEKLRAQTGCSYVLVVDSEGLRAPELDQLKSQKHDNELATFVIGLANMTFINIKGEVAGDIDDILQTSVHAFLRMQQIKFRPSCQFVHQNVSDSSEEGRDKFTDKLNHFTIIAAKQEKCEGKFTCFNDVIKFNDQNDVHCFSGLWMGSPPMAPINQGYSQSSQMLKLHFIKVLCKSSSHSLSDETGGLRLSAFNVKVADMWNALLKEDFVFSFKNTQELMAYSSLETAYSIWDWKFREGMIKWERIAENEISCTEEESAIALAREKCKKLEEHVSTLHDTIGGRMEAFFNGEYSEILVQWKAQFERRLDNLKEELKSHASSHCTRLGNSRRAISKFKQQAKKYAAKISEGVQEHIVNIRKKEQDELNKCIQLQQLNSDLFKKIQRRQWFTYEKLECYKNQTIITEEQFIAICEVCRDGLTEFSLERILFGGILDPKQVEIILIEGRQSEEELEEKFDEIWDDLIIGFQDTVPSQAESVSTKVEATLNEFVGHRYSTQLNVLMKKGNKTLEEHGTELAFMPLPKTHYTIVEGKLKQLWRKYFRHRNTMSESVVS